MLIGYFVNTTLPARAGEAARVVALNQRGRASRFQALGTVVAERTIDVLALLAILFAVAPFLPHADWLPRSLEPGAVISVALLATIALFALRGRRLARLLLRPLAALPGVSQLVLRAFDLKLGFEAGLLVVVATNLALIIPSGPAAIGVFEAATVAALAPFHVGRTSALSYGMLHALTALPFIAHGYIALHQYAVALRRLGPRREVAVDGKASIG
jgi:uncharacterized membrane protein YbhN (UPF0104 family)